MSFESTSNPDYSTFIALSKYARWLPEEGRRETWEETVNRYVDFWVDRKQITEEEAQEIFDAIYNLEVMPSMRALMTAGPALDRDNVAGFNCSYRELSGSGESIEVHTDEMKALDMEPVKINMSAPIAFDEIMYILLCGTGVGFSVERQFIAQLPTVGHKLPRKYYERTSDNYPKVDSADLSVLNMFTNTIEVADSKYGWASALRILIFELYNGNFDINWDVSQVRPAGAPLKLFGGRASGPEPLVDLFEYTADIFKKATNRKLNSLEVHGLVCKIAEIVVVGGVRRSALISLSNLSDDRMRHAKSGSWWESNPEFALANNSACYTEKPGMEVFMREWQSLVESKSGERGIFNREASQKQAARNGRRDYTYLFGTNPCSEIILRNQQFCNLSEIVARATDSFSDLRRKAKIATIIGTLQSSLTDFAYLSPKWKENTQEEALLGVSITGIMDHPVLNGTYAPPVFWEREWLEKDNFPATLEMLLERLKDETIETNKKWAARLGVNQSAAITCVNA